MESKKCGACGIAAKHICGGCRMVWYCSRDHQRQHWTAHRRFCHRFKVEQNKILGSHLVAVRHIPQGELILWEPPLLTGPLYSKLCVCLGCYVPLSAACVSCKHCGLPMCSANCAKSANHRTECRFISKVLVKKVDMHNNYFYVTVLRLLLLHKANPVRWQNLWQCESHRSRRYETAMYQKERNLALKTIRRLFKLTDFSDEEIMCAYGILKVNGFEVPWTEPRYLALFEWGSLFEHSCHANCFSIISKSGEIRVRSAVPIACGESLSVCYEDPLACLVRRRQFLKANKFILCRCVRCVDPTEMGTYFSAVRCLQLGCNGLCIPSPEWLRTEPGKKQEELTWQCCSCNQSLPYKQVKLLLVLAAIDLAALDRSNLDKCKAFLRCHEAMGLLSPDHAYLTKVRLILALNLGKGPNGYKSLTEDELHMKRQLSQHLLQLISALCPANLLDRGKLTYSLWVTLFEIGRRHFALWGINAATVQLMYQKSRKLALETIELLRDVPERKDEDKMVQHSMEMLKVLRR